MHCLYFSVLVTELHAYNETFISSKRGHLNSSMFNTSITVFCIGNKEDEDDTSKGHVMILSEDQKFLSKLNYI